MKSLPGTAKRFLVVITLFGIVACATVIKDHGGIYFGEHHVEIYPKAHLSPEDCNSLNEIVGKYNKQIYKIQTFEKGRAIRTHGELNEKYMRKGVVEEVMKQAQMLNFTGCALQAGVYVGSSTHKQPKLEGSASGSSTHPMPTPAELMSGSSTHPSPTPHEGSTSSSTHPVDHGKHSSTYLIRESDKLVEELKPILDKYNKK